MIQAALLLALIAAGELGSPTWTRREGGGIVLEKLGLLAWPVLSAPCRDLETAQRLDHIRERLWSQCVDREVERLLGDEAAPYIDAIPGTGPDFWSRWYEVAAGKSPAVDTGNWAQFRTATRFWLKEELLRSGGNPLSQLPGLLQVMRQRSAIWDQYQRWEK